MEMVKRKRIEVVADAPLCEWLAESAARAGIVHHSVAALASGAGQGGAWRDEDVSGAVAKRLFIAIASSEKASAFIDAIAPHLDAYGLLVILGDVEVVRGERF
ncbi:MAG: P-II family nitrogen regulator [Chakrabartia sp.]